MSKIKVVCVDDNDDVLMALRIILRRSQEIECRACLTSTQDLSAEIERSKPDVLLLDLTIPGENTLKALSALQALDDVPACIIFSGYDDAESVQAALAAGALRCVCKDAPHEELVQAVIDAAHSRATN